MAKSNPSLTSMTPHAPAERNFVDIHRDNVLDADKDKLANNGKNGMSGKSAAASVKVFPRKKFHFGNDEDQSIAGYDPKAGKINNEAVHIRGVKRTMGKKRFFVNERPHSKKPAVKKEDITEAMRKDQLGGAELFHMNQMNKKMDDQMWGRDDPTDPDRTGEISFHHAMRAWAARQRVHGDHLHDTNDMKGLSRYSKNMQKQGREKAARVTKEDFIGMLRMEKWDSDYETPKSKRGMWNGYSLEDLHKAAKTATGKRAKEIDFAIRAKTGWGSTHEGEVIYLSSHPKYNVKPHVRHALNIKNARDFDSTSYKTKRINGGKPYDNTRTVEDETLPWLRTIAEKKLSENCIQISDTDFLVEKVSLVKSIILGEKGTQWISQLGNRVADDKKDKAEVEKSIKRHKEKENNKK